MNRNILCLKKYCSYVFNYKFSIQRTYFIRENKLLSGHSCVCQACIKLRASTITLINLKDWAIFLASQNTSLNPECVLNAF